MELHFPLILDGATGTQLQRRGYTGAVCAEQWVLEHPETIREIQAEYIAAGSDIVYAPTFGANRVKLEENGIRDRVEDYNTRLAGLSRQTADGAAWVAGDIAPTGKFLAPMGDTGFEELVEIYTQQAAALEAAGVDLYVVETTMTMAEARAAVLAVKSVSRKPVFVTFTCDGKGKTLTGTDVTAALVVMQGMGVDAFGLNCSVGPEEMLVQLRRLAEYAEVPLIAKPNAGMPEIEDGKTVYRCTPEEFAAIVPEFAAAGVAVFGGCCGTTAAHIRALKESAAGAAIRRPEPLHPELLPLATEKLPVFLLPETRIGGVLACDGDLCDNLDDALAGDDPVVAIRITKEAELDTFAEEQYRISKPLCLVCEDAALLERALRLYQGRAMYEGPLAERELLPLQRKYGLVF